VPYCANCKYEYREGVALCPDCDLPLVDKLPSGTAATAPDQSWVAVCDIPNDFNSSLARGALESRNIPSIVMSSTFKAYGVDAQYTAQLMASPKATNVIMVPREFAEEATLVLEAILGDDFRQSDSV
jgi:hypothetical protein